jgi:hypothetical protein
MDSIPSLVLAPNSSHGRLLVHVDYCMVKCCNCFSGMDPCTPCYLGLQVAMGILEAKLADLVEVQKH